MTVIPSSAVAPAPSPLMARALQLAQSALYLTSPNPRVGCVLVDAHGQILGEGHTQAAGQAHAEIMALRDAQTKGHLLENRLPAGTTAYVTLEPCNHQGRTGPCAQALINSGVQRVVASIQDPNPQVCGRGFAALRAAGITVEIGDGAAASHEINLGFFKRLTPGPKQGAPWVRMKIAASLDGITALPNYASQWITGSAARADGHHWRARACAVLTGIGTALADDPQLNVREVATLRQPALVLVDRDLAIKTSAKLFIPKRPIWIYTAVNPNAPAFANKIKALEDLGAQIISLPSSQHPNKVDLSAMLYDLGSKPINELHIEAGFKLNGSLWREDLVDELLLYQSPQLLGLGHGLVNLGPFTKLSQGKQLRFHAMDRVGEDLRLLVRATT